MARVLNQRAGFMLWLTIVFCGCNLRGLARYTTVKRPLRPVYGHVAIRPCAEAVGGWRRPNRPTVCTVGAVAPGARLKRISGACSRFMCTRVRIVEPVPAKLEGEKWRRPNFFIVWPIEVP
jgi:hypothetical protein